MIEEFALKFSDSNEFFYTFNDHVTGTQSGIETGDTVKVFKNTFETALKRLIDDYEAKGIQKFITQYKREKDSGTNI